jgi:superfamily I DNA/RNA helicase
LDPEQERAVYGEGACALVIAGPGTGKTAVLAARIAHLIDRGMDPGSVLAVSFTVKASAELRERIIRTAGFRAEAVTAVTFHSFCAAVLREEYADAGLPADFTIITAEDKARILQNITQKKQNQGLSRYIEARKRALLHPGETVFPKIPRNWTFEPLPIDEKYEKYYGLYQSALVSAGFTDFDGLLTETVRLFTANPAILARWRDRYQAVFADEYQDVNFAQYILLFYIASPSLDFLHSPKEFLEENEKRAEEKKPEVSGKQEKPESVEKKEAEGKKKLWVVGDPNQGIYGFRGADRRFIDRFLADYPSAEVFNLSRSFRCGEAITGAAGLLMQVSLRGTDFNAALFRAKYPTDRAEADAIARRIAGLIGGTSFHAIDSGLADGASSLSGLSSCAILLRTLSLAEPFTQALQNYGIPFRLSRETPYLSTEPIASLIATLRDYAKRENAEKKEITGKERKKPASAVDEALKQLTLPKFSADRAKNARESLDRLRDIAEHYRDLTDFLDALAVDAEDGSVDIEPDGVRIMTIHGSKGLEFEHIFVPALEEGILPFTLYEPLSADRLEEEKRLLYVAMTRAKRGLYLSYAQKRFFQNRLLEYGRSRFFDVLEAAVPVFPAEKPQRKAKPQDPQMRLF